MSRIKKKIGLHARNKHNSRYDLVKLAEKLPSLGSHIIKNKYGDQSIDFFDSAAVFQLNKALLFYYYDIEYWEIPKGYLCPPIPGRADYIHHIADLIEDKRDDVRCLDIGVGSSCIYPIIGAKEYGWSFVGVDIDDEALHSAQRIIDENGWLGDRVELRKQNDRKNIFTGVINAGEKFDLSICNPPFHASEEEALAGNLRKLSNLKKKNIKRKSLNFGGKAHELWCEGGEKQFVERMIRESYDYSHTCKWFTTLISREELLDKAYKLLDNFHAKEIKTIPMFQGNKTSRILAWSFEV